MAKLENIYATKKAKYNSILADTQELGVDIEDSKELAQDDLVVQMSKMHAVLDSLSLEIQSLRESRFDKGMIAEQRKPNSTGSKRNEFKTIADS